MQQCVVAAVAAAAPPPRRSRRLRCSTRAAAAAPRVTLVPAPGCRGLSAPVQLDAATFVVGTAAGAQVRVSDASVAAEHARFDWRGGRLFVTDLDSASGTHFDGARLRAGVAYLTGDGATITFGKPAAGATAVVLQLQAAPLQAGGVDQMLADAFMQQFRTGAADVRALLRDDE